MGPLRRGLILALLWPGAAYAQTCPVPRPDWDGTPATPWDEAISLFATLPALALIALTLLALRLRHATFAVIVVLLWSFLVSAVVSYDPDGTLQAARDVGCRGDPILFIALVIAICAVTIFLTAPRKDGGAPDGET